MSGVVPPFSTSSAVAGSRDGRRIYFDRQAPGKPEGCESVEVAQVPISGGVPRKVIDGTRPVVSPDGRYLAVGLACSPVIVVLDLHNDSPGALGPLLDSRVTRAEPVAWSPDGRTILVRGYTQYSEQEYWLVAAAKGGVTRRVPVGSGYPTSFQHVTGFYGSTDRLVAAGGLGVAVVSAPEGATSPTIRRRLFDLPSSAGDFSILFDSDREGAQVVLAGAPPETAGTYRWTAGHRRLRLVARFRDQPILRAALVTGRTER